MGINRRGFIKLAGLTTLIGFAGKKTLGILTDEAPAPVPQAIGALSAKRWAMIFDLNKCRKRTGCTDCIQICHAIHNVPDFGNPKDDIKWIWKEDFEGAFPTQDHDFLRGEIRHSTPVVFCNHCDNPPCVRVCPTKATWKREDGIIMMDQHRCVGCRYCVVACPYGSRSFNWRNPRPFIKEINPDYPTRTRGVVEKCN
ncbi:MAG: 4Fe-4S dicluster domain-containing protein, partial [Candidatus Zixiibacteriota bacterium]